MLPPPFFLLLLLLQVGKIGANLRYYASSPVVVDATLGLFSDLASGYMSGKVGGRRHGAG